MVSHRDLYTLTFCVCVCNFQKLIFGTQIQKYILKRSELVSACVYKCNCRNMPLNLIHGLYLYYSIMHMQYIHSSLFSKYSNCARAVCDRLPGFEPVLHSNAIPNCGRCCPCTCPARGTRGWPTNAWTGWCASTPTQSPRYHRRREMSYPCK